MDKSVADFELYAAIAQRLEQIGGRHITRLEAITFAEHILARAKTPPRNPTRYVLAAINADTIAAERFIHEGKLPE